jgi:hypothetical protein
MEGTDDPELFGCELLPVPTDVAARAADEILRLRILQRRLAMFPHFIESALRMTIQNMRRYRPEWL